MNSYVPLSTGFPCTVLEIYKSRNKSAVYCDRLLAREERYPGDYESDMKMITPGEPGNQFTTTSARYSKLLEGEDIVDSRGPHHHAESARLPQTGSKELYMDSPSDVDKYPRFLILSGNLEDEIQYDYVVCLGIDLTKSIPRTQPLLQWTVHRILVPQLEGEYDTSYFDSK